MLKIKILSARACKVILPSVSLCIDSWERYAAIDDLEIWLVCKVDIAYGATWNCLGESHNGVGGDDIARLDLRWRGNGSGSQEREGKLKRLCEGNHGEDWFGNFLVILEEESDG